MAPRDLCRLTVSMHPLTAFWHLVNFVAPAVGVGFIAALLAKLLWRRHLAATSLRSLATWAIGAGLITLVGGLLLTGRDGRIGTYAVLVLATAAALWWKGLRR